MSREKALDIIYKGIFDTISSGYNAAMDRKRQKAKQGFEAAKRNMQLYTGYGSDEPTPKPTTPDVVSTPSMLPVPEADFEEVSSEPSPITDERRMLEMKPPKLPLKEKDPLEDLKNLKPSSSMDMKVFDKPMSDEGHEDTTGGPIEADEMKEMAKDPAHDKAFKQSYSGMMGDDGYNAALNQAMGESSRAFNREGKKANKEERLERSKERKKAVPVFDEEKKKKQEPPKKKAETKIPPAVKPEIATKLRPKKPVIEKPKKATKKGQKALLGAAKKLATPKSNESENVADSPSMGDGIPREARRRPSNADENPTKYGKVSQSGKGIVGAISHEDAKRLKLKRGMMGGDSVYMLSNDTDSKTKEPKKDKKQTTSKKNTQRESDEKAKKAMGL